MAFLFAAMFFLTGFRAFDILKSVKLYLQVRKREPMRQIYSVSVTDFGAVPDETLQTAAFQAAIDAVFIHGGGEVTVPAGCYHIGGLRLRSHVTLHLLEDAILLGSRHYLDYDSLENDTLEPITEEDKSFMGRWNHAMIRAFRARDMAIIGEKGALMDGGDCYDPQGEEGYRGPHGIHMVYCDSVLFSGYQIQNTGNWAHCIYHSKNLTARNLTALGGHDGFHVRGCENIIVEDCTFHTGDDCIAGFANVNMTVRRCDLNTACSCFRLGGTNVLVEDCKAWVPAIYGHRYTMSREGQAAMLPTNEHHRHTTLSFFTYFSDTCLPIPVEPGNMVFKNCTVDGTERFYQFNFSGSDPWQKGTGVKNVRFENMKVTNIAMPIVVYADPSLPTVLEMLDVEYSLRPGYENTEPIQAGNFERLSFRHVTFRNTKNKALITAWGQQGILETDRLNVEGNPALLVNADREFETARI